MNYYKVTAVINDVESSDSNVVNENFPFINGYEYVDLGLPSGIKWATLNIGASTSSNSGSYFAYGESKTKSFYSQSNYINNSWTDAASLNWGGTWRVPEVNEFSELINYCSWKWSSVNGVQGYTVTGPNGNSIFFPTTGLYLDSTKQSTDMGYYWSGSRWNDIAAWRLNFNNTQYQVAENYKFVGLPIRPVSD